MLKRFSLVAFGSALSSMLWSVSAYANQFIVYLPAVPITQTAQVKTIAPDAFYTQLESGQRVLQVGRYNNLPLAQKRVQQFRQAGFAAEIRSVAPKVSSVPALPPPIPVQPYPAPPPTLPGVPSAVDTSAPTPIEVSRPTTAPQPISSLPPAPPVAPVPVATAPAETVPQEELRYFVIIPTTSNSIMQRVRAIAPTAKFKTSNRGPYIEVQGYPDRASAETMSATMRGQGFDARVAYF
jgi:hypothetical protein